MTLDIPEVWYTFAELFHQDFLVEHPDFVTGLRLVLEGLSADSRLDLLQFLQTILGSGMSSAELVAIWEGTETSIIVPGDDIEKFFQLIASELESSLPP